MLTRSLFARLEAKPGREDDVALGPTTFGVFDAFGDEAALQAHLDGPIAAALMQKAPDLLAEPPAIERIEVLGAKMPRS